MTEHMLDVTRASLLKGTPERRGISEFEIRESGGTLEFNGYAAVWDQTYEVSDWMGTFTESVQRSALQRTLSRNPNVVLNTNHGRNGDLPLARTSSGTLRISTDTHGLAVSAGLDLRNPKVQELQSVLERRDTEDMSWAFRVTKDDWSVDDDGNEARVIQEANIDGGDVSIVTAGANPGTSAGLRSALDAIANLDTALAARSGDFDPAVVRAAYNKIGALLVPKKALLTMNEIRAMEPGDDLPSMVAGLDAVIDAALKCLDPTDDDFNPAQAHDLLLAAESQVDELMEAMSIPDPDDARSKIAAPPRKTLSIRAAHRALLIEK